MEIRVLGPLQISGTGGVLYVRGRRQRVVLSMLALNVNRVTTREQLIDAAWGSRPPGTPRSQIQICISGLRKTFHDIGMSARIVTRDPGYLLETSPGQLDSQVFEKLVDAARLRELDGDVVGAVAALRSAMALWRGPALADVPGDVARLMASRMDEQRVTADIDRVRLELDLGRHNEIIADLRALVEEHPLREELHRYLMLALYRAGRQSDALEAFRRVRSVLVEEVGVEPGAQLQALERAILHRDAHLDLPVSPAGRSARQTSRVTEPVAANDGVPPVVGGQLPAGIADFTGRDDTLADIVTTLSVTGTGQAGFLPTVAISGRGGVGKSCLAVQAAHILRDQFPDGHLYATLRLSEENEVLARFLRALGVPAAGIPADRQDKVELYRAKLTGRRMLVVLEDADDEDQVLALIPGLPGCAAIVTSRSRLGALPGAHWFHLSELDKENSLLFLARQLGDDRVRSEHADAATLVEYCAGLPLALRIAAARLVAKPHLRLAEFVSKLTDETRRLDELSHRGLDLRGSIGAGYERLTEDAKRLLRRLSVIKASSFPEWVGAEVLCTEPDTSRALMETLTDAGMLDVESTQDGTVRYRFAGLVRPYAREQLAANESIEECERAAERLA